MKEKKGVFEPLGSVVEGVLKKLGLDRRYQESQIALRWKEWVGEAIARHTQPERVVNKKLVIYVDSSPWLMELSRYYKEQILHRIQEALGKDVVKEIIFKIGELSKEKETDPSKKTN